MARTVGRIGLTNVGRFTDSGGIFPDQVSTPATQFLLPSLFDESVDTFFAPQVNLKIFPGLYTDSDTFFAPKVSHGLKPSLYADADTFFAPTVTQPAGSQTLLPNLYTDLDTFFTPVVKGRYTLTPSLYTDADTFFVPKVSRNAKPSLYVDPDTFFTPVVKGRYTLTPSLYSDPDIFGAASVSQGLSDQFLFAPMFGSGLLVQFFSPTVEGGGQGPVEEIFQGGGKQYRYEKINNSSDIDRIMHCGDVLTIRYKDGKVYNYCDVPEKKFDKIAHSRSPGSYVHNNIKEKYSYRKVK